MHEEYMRQALDLARQAAACQCLLFKTLKAQIV